MHSPHNLGTCLLLLAACTPAAELPGTSTGDPGSTGGTADLSSTGDPTTGSSSGAASSSGGEVDPLLEGAPAPNTSPDAQVVDVFGDLGLRYWFVVEPDQVERMNLQNMGGGEIYVPEGSATHAEHLFVTSTGPAPTIADYGKVEVRLIGQSTFRPWTESTIPNIKVDTDEFVDGLEIGGTEHIRFHNGLVGSIYREKIALEVYTRLGYPAPRATFAWVGGNVWGPGIEIPYTVVENYKKAFCKRHADAWGGGCNNMWEFVGDLGQGAFEAEVNCQLSGCDPTRARQFEELAVTTPPGPGYKAALADWLDWDAFHRFQCISWLLWTGDDALHNMNNVVIVERQDGRFQYLPYSVDISGGQDWFTDVSLLGSNVVAYGCQADPACWADAIDTCEEVIDAFVALDPAALVDEVHAQLAEQDMLRSGDEGRHAQIRGWYAQRAAGALTELDLYRDPPCQLPNTACEGACVDVQECALTCQDGEQQCGPACVPVGECFDCQPPFEPCFDGSCVPPGTCP